MDEHHGSRRRSPTPTVVVVEQLLARVQSLGNFKPVINPGEEIIGGGFCNDEFELMGVRASPMSSAGASVASDMARSPPSGSLISNQPQLNWGRDMIQFALGPRGISKSNRNSIMY